MIINKHKRLITRLGLERWKSIEVSDGGVFNPIMLDFDGGFLAVTPKAACTSMKFAWLKLHGHVKAGEELSLREVHSRTMHIGQIGLSQARETAKPIYRIINEPANRLASVYAMYQAAPLGYIPRGLSVNEFLVWLSRENSFNTDMHLVPQTIGYHEDMVPVPLTKDGMALLSDSLGVEVPHMNKSKDGVKPVFSEPQLDFIKQLYPSDYELYAEAISNA